MKARKAAPGTPACHLRGGYLDGQPCSSSVPSTPSPHTGQKAVQIRGYAPSRPTVPQLGNAMTASVGPLERLKKRDGLGLDELVGPLGNRYRALGVGA